MFFSLTTPFPWSNFEKPSAVDTRRSQEGSSDHKNGRRLHNRTDRTLLAAKYQNGCRLPQNHHDVLRSPLPPPPRWYLWDRALYLRSILLRWESSYEASCKRPFAKKYYCTSCVGVFVQPFLRSLFLHESTSNKVPCSTAPFPLAFLRSPPPLILLGSSALIPLGTFELREFLLSFLQSTFRKEVLAPLSSLPSTPMFSRVHLRWSSLSNSQLPVDIFPILRIGCSTSTRCPRAHIVLLSLLAANRLRCSRNVLSFRCFQGPSSDLVLQTPSTTSHFKQC